jgi:hypothetical protein
MTFFSLFLAFHLRRTKAAIKREQKRKEKENEDHSLSNLMGNGTER